MGFSIRIFFVDDDDNITRISRALYDRILHSDSKESLLEYKNTRVRYAEVILELENRKPISIERIVYGFLEFDSKGMVDKDFLNAEHRVAMSMITIPLLGDSSNVVHASDRFAKKRFKDNFSWTPSFELEHAIIKKAFE